MSPSVVERNTVERAYEVLRRAGNPFRNYFARNPDDEVCARYHVPELFASERDLLLHIVDLYRYDPMTHSEVVPILGNKGAGKTHLLHSIKHGTDGAWQMLVTPAVYQKDTEFLEYLLFQIIDTLLGGGKQKGVRPLEYVSDQIVRRMLSQALRDLSAEERLELFPTPGLSRLTRMLGLGHGQAQERCQWLADNLSGYGNFSRTPTPIMQALTEAGLRADQAFELLVKYIERTEAHNTSGLMRRAVLQGFGKAALLQDEADLAGFLTYGFAELDFQVRPTRQDLVLSLFKTLMEVFRQLKTPVVVAFDQLEDLLLARRTDDCSRVAEAFFAGIVQVMHQIGGMCFLVFVERGLWNRFIGSLDGFIQDRLNNPVHVPRHGTVKALRLEAPPPDLVRRVVETRLKAALEELPEAAELPDIFPFTDEQIIRIARTEPTLRDMLQQFRHLFDHLVYGSEGGEPRPLTGGGPAREATAEAAFMSAMPRPAVAPSELNRTSAPVLAAVNRVSDALKANDEAPTSNRMPPIPTAAVPPTPPPAMPVEEEPNAPVNRVAEVMIQGPRPLEVSDKTASSAEPMPTHRLPTEVPSVPPMPATSQFAVKSVLVVESQSPSRMPEPTAPKVEVQAVTPPISLDASYAAVPLAPLAPTPQTVPFGSSGGNRTAPAAPLTRATTPTRSSSLSTTTLVELWEQEQRAARRKLEPEGALTGATRELQAGLGAFLQLCHEHGVKVGPWRLQHVVGEYSFGDHPTYGAVTIAHWACKDGQPWKVGIGLFLARGAGKPKDLEVKLSSLDVQPAVIDHLILLRPEDDLTLTGKSKTLWQDAEKRGRSARIEALPLDRFAMLSAFPRWLATITDALPDGQPVPNLADVIQETCERLLEQVCMPIHG